MLVGGYPIEPTTKLNSGQIFPRLAASHPGKREARAIIVGGEELPGSNRGAGGSRNGKPDLGVRFALVITHKSCGSKFQELHIF